MILGVIQPGMALVVLIGVLVILAVGLLASGIVKVNIEVCDEDDEKLNLEEIKALDDSTLKNRVVKWLVKLYEKELEKNELKEKGDGGDDSKD